MLQESFRGFLTGTARSQIPWKLRAKISDEDLVQEVFLEAQQDFDQFHGTLSETLSAWLRCILAQNLRDGLRAYVKSAKRQVDREVSLDDTLQAGGLRATLSDPEPSPCSAAIEQKEDNMLAAARAQLPPLYLLVLVLREEKLPFNELGDLLSSTPDAVRMLWVRANALLRKMCSFP